MGLVNHRLFHPNGIHVLEVRNDGSYFIQSGLVGFYVQDLRHLVDLRDLLEEHIIMDHDVEEYYPNRRME